MSLFGKILAILNVLLALALLVLIPLDWGQHQRWAYAVFRYDLLMEGLPLDEKETSPDGEPRVDDLVKGTLEKSFQGVGEPVKTQQAEVQRVRKDMEARLDNPEIPGTREQKLAAILIPLATSYNEREALRQRIANPKNEATDLEQVFNDAFSAVSDARRPIPERKQIAAHLLIAMAEVAPAQPVGGEEQPTDPLASTLYKRMIVVVGVAETVAELDRRALLMDTMARQAQNALDYDQALFLEQHGRLIYALLDLANELRDQVAYLNEKRGEAVRQEERVKERMNEVIRLTQQRDALIDTIQQKLTRQEQMEQEAFTTLNKLRNTAARNRDLERQIRQLESSGTE